MKGGFKAGIKYISNIFVVKEEEIEIGLPTDVKHVAHIGWDGQSAGGTAPTWMREFKTGPEFTASSITKPPESSSDDFSKDDATASTEHPGTLTKKPKRKKPKVKPKAKPAVEDNNPKPADILLV